MTTPCLIREINLSKLSKGAAQKLCHEAAAPLFRIKSPNIVKVLHVGFSEEEGGGRDSEGNHSAAEPLEQDCRLHIITELFLDSIYSLVSSHSCVHRMLVMQYIQRCRGSGLVHETIACLIISGNFQNVLLFIDKLIGMKYKFLLCQYSKN